MAREFSKQFYMSREWNKVRMYVLMRDKFKCQKCGRAAQEVHHKKHLTPENILDPYISLNPENLISLCKDCHFEEHRDDKREGTDDVHALPILLVAGKVVLIQIPDEDTYTEHDCNYRCNQRYP